MLSHLGSFCTNFFINTCKRKYEMSFELLRRLSLAHVHVKNKNLEKLFQRTSMN